MKNKIVDIVCLCVVGAVFGGAALWNLVQPDRPTISETENRMLATMPEFTVSSLADGSYFAGISSFVSNTFVERDRLVGLSRRMDTLKGFDYALEGADNFVVLNPSGEQKSGNTEEDEEKADAISAVFDALLNGTASSGQGADPDGEPSGDPTGDHRGDPDGNKPAETEAPETSSGEEASGEETGDPNEGSEHGEILTEDDNPEETTPAETEGTDQAGETGTEDSTESDPEVPENGAETEAPTEPETDAGAETEAEEAAPAYEVKSLELSRESVNLTVGTGTVLYAYADSTDPNGPVVHWTNSDKSVATISINPSGGIDVKAVGPGTTEIACSLDTFRAVCTVNVSELTVGVDFTPPTSDENESADFLPDGLFIYGDGVYTQAFYSPVNAEWYAKTAAVYAQKFGCRVSTVVAPVSSMVIDNPNVKSKISDQGEILKKMRALCDTSVNFVDTYTPLYEHRDEYLFFRTDHHWTQRGAYYAYAAFAESVGLTPTPLSFFDFQIRNDNYAGSMYKWTNDARVLSFADEIEAFYPTKKHTMTVTNTSGGTNVYDSSIVSVNKSYVTFIAGDNPYTVINVPENPQDKNILVLKDSFGNAFVPFLCEHYGNIIVVDVRHTNMNVYEQLKDYGLTDIVFVNNIQAANSYAWAKMFMAAVGVTLP